MNAKIKLFLNKKLLSSKEGQDLIKEHIADFVKVALDPEVILGVTQFLQIYLKESADAIRAISPEDRKEIGVAITSLQKDYAEYSQACECLADDTIKRTASE